MGKRKPRPRNGGTMTEAAYWGKVRAVLRKSFPWYAWKPAKDAVQRHTRIGQCHNPKTGRINKTEEFQCQRCGEWFFLKPATLVTIKMEVDHIEECGSLKCNEDLAGWLERLTCEDTFKFQPLCKPCHHKKTEEVKSL